MDFLDIYKGKLTTAAEAVAAIPSNSKMEMGMAMAQPPALLQALAGRARAGHVEALRRYYFETTVAAGKIVLDFDLADRIEPYCMFVTAADRALIKKGVESERKVLRYVPNNFHQAPRLLIDDIGIESFVCTVSSMDQHGYLSFGVGNDYSWKVARSAERLIVEVNRHMPRVVGSGAQIHVSELSAIAENDVPLLELPVRGGSPEDETISKLIAETVPDGACLQMGVGALPNLVCAALNDRNDLGVHTEALCPGLVDLTRARNINNRAKSQNVGKTVYTFAMGQKSMYDFLDNNPSVESWPVDYINDPVVIARNDNVIFINGTIEIDLTGACNSEHMLGHQYSASGDQLDFVRDAHASKQGKSIIAASSTTAHGKLSQIVGKLTGPVTTPRIDTHWVVTEHGRANLKGLSSTERVTALVELGHPDFRDGLMASARELHLV